MVTKRSRSQTGGMDECDLGRAAAGCPCTVDLTAAYRRLQPRLHRYLRSALPAQADDLASQVWLDAVAGIDRFRGDNDDLARWLFTIGRRRLIDARRAAARAPVDSRPPDHPHLVGVPDRAAVESVVVARSATTTLLERLPRDQAEVVLLRVVGGFSADEVGEITGRHAGAVRVIQHRALRQLARELALAG